MKKPTNRKPTGEGTGDYRVNLKEVPYQNKGTVVGYRVEATWREGRARKKRWLPNWRAAEDFARDQSKRLEAMRGKTSYTVADAIAGYEKQCHLRMNAKVPTLSPQTFSGYRRRLEALRVRFGRLPLHQFKSNHLREWILDLSQCYKPRTIHSFCLITHEVLKYAVQQEMLASSPLMVDRVEWPRDEQRRPPPQTSDMERLSEFIHGPKPDNMSFLIWSCCRVVVGLAGICGLRAGEIAGLQWDDIDFTTGEITIQRVVTGTPSVVRPRPKTKAGYRRIPTNPDLRNLILEHMEIYKEVFGKPVGHLIRGHPKAILAKGGTRTEYTAPASVSMMFISTLRRAGLVNDDGSPRFPLHSLRHWFGSKAASVPYANIHQLATWLGHKNTSTTLDTYGHYIPDPDARVKFEQIPSFLAPPIVANTIRLPPSAPAPTHEVIPPAQLERDDDAAIEGEFVELMRPAEFPLEVPEFAERWLRSFMRALWKRGSINQALVDVGKTRRQLKAELTRCKLPQFAELEAMALRAIGDTVAAIDGTVLEDEPAVDPALPCPWDLPEGAPAWMAPYVRCLDRGMTHLAASQAIRKSPDLVSDELQRWKLPQPVQLKRRLREKRIAELYAAGYQDSEIARILSKERGGRVASLRVTVGAHRRELRKPTLNKSLRGKGKTDTSSKTDARPGHKNQLKLL